MKAARRERSGGRVQQNLMPEVGLAVQGCLCEAQPKGKARVGTLATSRLPTPLKAARIMRYTQCMAANHPSVAEIEAAIGEALARGRKRIDDVAQILLVSRSTLERAIPEDRSFTDLRQKVQMNIALPRLKRGDRAWIVADAVCLSPDRLRIMVREETGLTPRQIIWAAQARLKVEEWKSAGPIYPGTTLYRERLRRWDRIDHEMTELLGDFSATHPLADWAKQLLLAIERPDYRRQPYRDQLRQRRRKESERFQRRLQQALQRITEEGRQAA